MKRMIITGVTGFIGKYFALEMLSAGYAVYGAARDPGRIDKELCSDPNFHTVEVSMETICAEVFPEGTYEGFFHFAWGGVNRDEIDSEEVHRNNYENSVRCLDCAEQLGCVFFLDAGSRMEYGYTQGVMGEDLQPHPDKAYGVWKERFYQHAFARMKERHSFSYVHIRIFSVIGIGDHPWSITETACRRFLKNEKMEFGPCTQLWNFMAVEDAAKAIRLLYEKRDCFPEHDNRIVNVANYDTRVLRGFIEEIYQIAHSSSELIFRTGEAGTSTYADVGKLTAVTGWKSEIPYFEAIKKILDHYRKNAYTK